MATILTASEESDALAAVRAARTLPQAFQATVARFADRVALRTLRDRRRAHVRRVRRAGARRSPPASRTSASSAATAPLRCSLNRPEFLLVRHRAACTSA